MPSCVVNRQANSEHVANSGSRPSIMSSSVSGSSSEIKSSVLILGVNSVVPSPGLSTEIMIPSSGSFELSSSIFCVSISSSSSLTVFELGSVLIFLFSSPYSYWSYTVVP